MKQEQSLNQSLVSTIANTDLKDVYVDLAEVAIDSVLKDGILKDIPVVSSLFGLYKGTIAVRDHLFYKKVVHFLSAIKDMSANEREEMFANLEIQGHNRNAIEETLLLILDKIENYNKVRLLGMVVKSLSSSIITYSDFERFSSLLLISSSNLLDLPKFRTEIKTDKGNSLEAHGLIMRKSLWVDEYPEQYTY